MDDNVIQFPGTRAGLPEPEPGKLEGDEKARVLAYQGSAAPKGYVVLPKIIPPADRKKCPHPGCRDFAMYTFSWYLKDIDLDGEIYYIKVYNRLEIISCSNRGCIARARNIVRKNFWNSTVYPIALLT
jgi:hypothetical protein